MSAFLDDEIGFWWCLGDTWRCTAAEAIGIWTALFFWVTMVIVTVVHSVMQHSAGSAAQNEEATRRHLANSPDDDVKLLCWLAFYFFSFAGGSLLWALAGGHWVHPVQSVPIQLVGVAILVACAFLFVAAHIQMGENWSPEPEQKARHQLVTHGLFSWARHPIYAIFLWATIGTLLATLNWLLGWCVSGVVMITLRRIETEERILIELFGDQYLTYRQHVSALGAPWHCLGFDSHLVPSRGACRWADADEDDSPDSEISQEAARREAAAHGCCCACCSLRAELWACMAIDVTSIVGLAVEIPRWAPVPASLHAVDVYRAYLVFSAFSACLILFAMLKGRHAAWPRRLLVRFMSLKLPVFLIVVMGYFTVSPWASPLAEWVCQHDFEQMRSVTGGDHEKCVGMFPWLCTLNNAIYIVAYGYSFRASFHWFRCHPSNDDKGVWRSRAEPDSSDEYTRLWS